MLGNPLKYIDPDGHQDGYDIRFQKTLERLWNREINEKQYWKELRGGAFGVGAGLAIVAGGFAGVRAATTILMWAARNPDKVQQIGEELLQLSTGNPTGSRTLDVGGGAALANVPKGAITVNKNIVHLPNVQGLAEKLPFVSNSFGRVTSSFLDFKVLQGSALKSFLSEAQRVLVSGGKLEIRTTFGINPNVTKASLVDSFQKAGFKDIKVIAEDSGSSLITGVKR